ncbi:MAG: hypothetical protein M5R42_08565 [Rhodocyclaceae bacterium]|nr:hypothetical protein [Rhodocyclaceae bacterium]
MMAIQWHDMRALSVLGLFVLSTASRADVFVRDDIVTNPMPDFFTACHGNGCLNLAYLSLKPDQWRKLLDVFHPLAGNAEEERNRVRRAIALMEKYVGEATGTWNDKGGTFNGGEGQMDCIDESINATLYLTMFQKYGLMRGHPGSRIEPREAGLLGDGLIQPQYWLKQIILEIMKDTVFGLSTLGFWTTANRHLFFHWKSGNPGGHQTKIHNYLGKPFR